MLILALGLALASPSDDLSAQASELALRLANTDPAPPWRWKQLRAMVDAWEAAALAEDPLAPVGRRPTHSKDAGALAWSPWPGMRVVEQGWEGDQLYAIGVDDLGVRWATADGAVRVHVPSNHPMCAGVARVADQVWFADGSAPDACDRVRRHRWSDGAYLGELPIEPRTRITSTGDVAWLVHADEVRSVNAQGQLLHTWTPPRARFWDLSFASDGGAFLHRYDDRTTLYRVGAEPWTAKTRCTFVDDALLCATDRELTRSDVRTPTKSEVLVRFDYSWPGAAPAMACDGATVWLGHEAHALRPCDVTPLWEVDPPPPFQPGGPRTVSGRVVDANGRPVKKVDVLAALDTPACAGGGAVRCAPEVVRTRTDRKGRFTLTLDDDQPWHLLVQGDGWVSDARRVLPATGDVEAVLPAVRGRAVHFDPVPATVELDGARFPVPDDGTVWTPPAASLSWWGPEVAIGKAKVLPGDEPLVPEVKVETAPSCHLDEAPEALWSCTSTPPREAGIWVVDRNDDHSLSVRAPRDNDLGLPGVDPSDILAQRFFPEVAPPAAPGTRHDGGPIPLQGFPPTGQKIWFIARVRVLDGSEELWSGWMPKRRSGVAEVVDRIPRPLADIDVVDTEGKPVPYAAVPCWDPYLRQTGIVQADASGHARIPSDDEGQTWVSQGGSTSPYVPIEGVWEVLALPSPAEPIGLTSVWRLRSGTGAGMTVDTTPRHDRPTFAVGPGLWRRAVRGQDHDLLITTEVGMLHIDDQVRRYDPATATVGAPPPPSDASPFPGLRTLHHSEVDVKRRVPLAYPEAAAERRLGDQRCMAWVHIDAGGTPVAVEVDGCPKVFHHPTEDALMAWRWYPPKVQGTKQAVKVRIGISYKQR